jgi:hypothetical protein
MQESDIFERHYHNYLEQMANIDFASIQMTLGLKKKEAHYFVSFFGRDYLLSGDGIQDDAGRRPSYVTCAVLAKYILLCPEQCHEDRGWAAFKDFKRTSHFLNANFFASDTERVIAQAFGGRPDDLRNACLAVGGVPNQKMAAYDLAMQFQALPRISLLLLFNDGDEDFPVYATVLFQKQAEFYLDPESLAMTSAVLARRLSAV